VITEPFTQWVIEDSFCNDRPPLEEVGVRFVPDVGPYETMKTRLLNAGHCTLAYLGYLAGHRTTDQAMADPVFREYLTRLLAEQIAPLLPEVPGIDLGAYQRELVERLDNPRMADQLARLGRRGSTKIPNYLLPSISAAIDADRPHHLLDLAVAGWLRFLRAQDYGGEEFTVEGPRQDLVPVAQQSGDDAGPLLTEGLFGPLRDDARFVGPVTEALQALGRHRPREVIGEYLVRPGTDS
jgi:fructuronate reductase/mannitol 2-dehydrogenase